MGPNRHAEHFLKTLRAKVLQKQKQYPKWFAANARLQNDIAKARTLADFDEWYTAPAHDFASAADYWQSGSCADSLQRVKLPLLCINAMNDPIVPPSSLPNPKTTPPNIRIRRPQTGAHAAFTGTPKNWLPMQLSDFFARHAPAKNKREVQIYRRWVIIGFSFSETTMRGVIAPVPRRLCSMKTFTLGEVEKKSRYPSLGKGKGKSTVAKAVLAILLRPIGDQFDLAKNNGHPDRGNRHLSIARKHPKSIRKIAPPTRGTDMRQKWAREFLADL